MLLDDFWKLHEYCKIMSDYGREDMKRRKKEAEAQANANK